MTILRGILPKADKYVWGEAVGMIPDSPDYH